MRATVAILTFNGQESLAEVLDAVLAQRVEFPFEVLVIDSGSTDGTLEIVKLRPAVRLHQIPNSEFGHGRTRNLAVSLSGADFVAFLTQDAVPADPDWLAEMLRPFDLNADVAGVFGRQVPRADCCPTVKRDVAKVFAGFGPDTAVLLQRRTPTLSDDASRQAMSFFSDVNSAVRRSVMERIPFRDVAYAEDQAFGRDVIDAGLIKAYAPRGRVLHSHSYPLGEYFHRMLAEMRGLRDSVGVSLDTPLGSHLRVVAGETLRDWRFILRDPDYSRWAKVRWLPQAPLYQVARRLAIRIASHRRPPGWARLLGVRA